ncbi:flagellin [Acidovorax benzenivorans]|nr:flagellin [Acidovorax benzenivorans]
MSLFSTRKANEALQVFDSAINSVSRSQANLDAVQSRLEATIANFEISSEKTAAARARIVDADIAQETAQLARQQILQNAGTAMVAQTDALPEQMLHVLKGIGLGSLSR